MKYLIAAALIAAGPAAADVAGTWKTQPGDTGTFATVQIAPCGAEICGTIVGTWNPDGSKRESEVIGKPILWGMKPDGANAWSGGKIWAPDRDKTYASKMQLSGDALKVSGCVLVVCRSQTWTRVRN